MPNEFEKEPSPVAPGTSGEVGRGIEDRAADRVAQAGDVLAMIENEPRAVESLVNDANKGYEAGIVGPDDTAAADLVGELYVVEPGADISDVARELHGAASGPLGESLGYLAEVAPETAKLVMDEIDAVVSEHGLRGGVDIVEPPSAQERAELLAEKMGGDVSPDVLHQGTRPLYPTLLH